MRSKKVTGTLAGQQCMYDKKGRLITGGYGAGTADRVRGYSVSVYSAPAIFTDVVNSTGHYGYDVVPFFVAQSLDRSEYKQVHTGLYKPKLDKEPEKIGEHVYGRHVDLYMAVRPTNQGRHRSGKACPKNIVP